MRRLGMLFCLMAACSTSARTSQPTSPTRDPAMDAPQAAPDSQGDSQAAPQPAPDPQLATATAAAGEDVSRYDRPGRCEPAQGTVEVDFPSGYSVIALVTWYMDATCKMVLVPRQVLERRTARVVSERIDAARAEELFQTLLGHLRLTSLGSNELITIHPIDGGPGEGPLLGVLPQVLPEPEPASEPAPRKRPGRATEQPHDETPAITRELDAGIKKIDETHYVIRRDLLDRFFGDPTRYGHHIRIVPALENGTTVGMKVFAVRPGSIYARLGLHNGDVVRAVNGTSIATPDRALEAYSQLPTATRAELDITRRGQSLVLVIDIAPAK